MVAPSARPKKVLNVRDKGKGETPSPSLAPASIRRKDENRSVFLSTNELNEKTGQGNERRQMPTFVCLNAVRASRSLHSNMVYKTWFIKHGLSNMVYQTWFIKVMKFATLISFVRMPFALRALSIQTWFIKEKRSALANGRTICARTDKAYHKKEHSSRVKTNVRASRALDK